MMRELIKKILGERLCRYIQLKIYTPSRLTRRYLDYDYKRFVKYSGAFSHVTYEQCCARIVMTYHIIEKGLTMPARRLGFGKSSVRELVRLVNAFEKRFGLEDCQVRHAIGVLIEYWRIHESIGYNAADSDIKYWEMLKEFVLLHSDVCPTEQLHFVRKDFYSHNEDPFPMFARARHTVRHYSGKDLPLEKIKKAVALACTTPSACNRQHCRVYCIRQRDDIGKILDIQGGCRGFGQNANKILVVTANLEDTVQVRERNDIYINGGMFVMNLCYALFYYEIAHCVLNWSKSPDEDLQVRHLIPVKPSETIIALLSCGEPTEEFDVAISPRKDVDSMLTIV